MEGRHQKILKILREEKSVKVQDLSKTLDTSMVTIRKDLKILEGKRLLFRNHGGASLESPYVHDRSVSEKEFINAADKAAVGKKAAGLIGEDQYIILASGTTVLAMAEFINPLNKLTIVTNALNVGIKLAKRDNIEVLQLGGYIRPNSYSVIGHYSEMILNETICSKLFLGVDGLDLEYGLTTSNALEAHLNQQMIKSSKEVIVLADSTKFGKKSFGRICGLEDIDCIITDSKIDSKTADKIVSTGINLIICE